MTRPKAGARRCAYVHPDGGGCGAYALQGSELCYFHDPRLAEQRAINHSEAGKKAHRRTNVPHMERGDIVLPPDIVEALPEETRIHITTTADLKDLLERTLTLAFAGRANAQLVNSITGALREARQLLETEVLEKRIEELERRYGVQV